METDEELGFHFTSALNAYWEGPEPDVDGDSEAMLAEAKSGDEEPDWDPSKPPPVDSDARVENGYVSVILKRQRGVQRYSTLSAGPQEAQLFPLRLLEK